MHTCSHNQTPTEFTPLKVKDNSLREELTLSMKAKAYLQKKDGRRISDIAKSAKKNTEQCENF